MIKGRVKSGVGNECIAAEVAGSSGWAGTGQGAAVVAMDNSVWVQHRDNLRGEQAVEEGL